MIDEKRFGEEIVAEFKRVYGNDTQNDFLAENALHIAADAAAIAIKLYEEKKQG